MLLSAVSRATPEDRRVFLVLGSLRGCEFRSRVGIVRARDTDDEC